MSSRSVALIFDPDFGEKIKELFMKMHIWIIETPQNKKIVECLWQLQKDKPFEYKNQATIFSYDDFESINSIVETVDEHHNAYSQSPPYNELNIYGMDITKRNNLFDLGFKEFNKTNFGFTLKK